MEFQHFTIVTRNLSSLVWKNNVLMDILAGGIEYALDGSIQEPNIHTIWAYPFDSVISSGIYSILYENSGTKAILLKKNKLVRELNRSFYYAKDYGYPICFTPIPDGELGIIHCPLDYNVLEIEKVSTGDILTKRPQNAQDIFHSRLQVSPNGKWLLSNGWVWHPWNILCVYDLHEALKNPNHLDTDGIPTPLTSTGEWEIDNAVVGDNKVVACLCTDDRFQLGVLQLEPLTFTQVDIAQPTGIMMMLEPHWIVAFFDYPKVIDIRTGEVVLSFPDFPSPIERAQPSVTFYEHDQPILALDPANKRFAMGNKKKIDVIIFR